MDHFETLERTLAKCIDAMFCGDDAAAYALEQAPEPIEGEVIVASLGFACQGAQGGVLILAPRETIRELPPVLVDGPTEAAECDVVGELSNMLVGRLKNQLLHRGVVLLVGTPMTAVAQAARVLASAEPTSTAWYCVELPMGPLFVRLDARFEPAFAFSSEAPESARSAGAEGDMLFF